MDEFIVKALSVIRSSPGLDDEAIFERLVSSGIEPSLADRLQAFLPMAYTRLLLEKSGARFSDCFEEEMPDGEVTQRPLSSEPAWNASITFARAEIARGISAQDLFSVAGRSAELDAANQALNAGRKLDDGVFGPSRILWSEKANEV
jgi:hypothetical protein